MPKHVMVSVNEDSSVKIDYRNFQGASCLSESRRLRMLLAQFGIRLEQTNLLPKPELLAARDQEQATDTVADLVQGEEG